MKIKKNDIVIVNSGTYKNQQGKVLKVFPKLNKVLIEGVNFATKHIKPHGDIPGNIMRIERPIHISNVNHIDPLTNKATRVKFIYENEKKHIVTKNGTLIR